MQRPDESDALREVAEHRRGGEAERVGAAPRAASAIEKAADAGDVDMQAITRMLQRLHEPVEQFDASIAAIESSVFALMAPAARKVPTTDPIADGVVADVGLAQLEHRIEARRLAAGLAEEGLVVAAALAALIALPRAREPPHVYHRRGRPTQELVPR